MDTKTCPKCGAHWLEGQLYWSTGAKGTDEDLAGLVCDQYSDDTCVNSAKGTEHNGQTWEKRAAFIDGALAEFERNQKKG